MEELIKIVSNNLKTLIKDNNLTIKEFCSLTNTSYSTIRNLLNCKVKYIKTTTLLKICKHCNLKLSHLIGV